jgi:hypothetical protein
MDLQILSLTFRFLGKPEYCGSPDKIPTCPATQDIDHVISRKTGIMLVSSGKLPHFTVSRCTDCQMFRSRHARSLELQPSKDTIYVRLDAAQRGLGTGSCGPQTLPEYQVNGDVYEVNFWIKPVGVAPPWDDISPTVSI